MALTVVSYNVRNALGHDGWNIWPLRRRSTAAVLQRLQPDIAALQEGWRCQVRYLVRHLPGFAYAGVGRNNGVGKGEHCAILYRRERFTLEREATRWFSDTPDGPGSISWGNALPRIVTMAWFTDQIDGSRFGVANAHLDERSDDIRRRSTTALVAWIDGVRAAGDHRPWIVVGDLNATPADASIQVLLAAGWRDALAAVPSYGPESATANRFSGRRDGARIDHILVEGSESVEEARIDHSRPYGRLASDHWPVVARLR